MGLEEERQDRVRMPEPDATEAMAVWERCLIRREGYSACEASAPTRTHRSLPSLIGALRAALTPARAHGDGQARQPSKTDQQISLRNR